MRIRWGGGDDDMQQRAWRDYEELSDPIEAERTRRARDVLTGPVPMFAVGFALMLWMFSHYVPSAFGVLGYQYGHQNRETSGILNLIVDVPLGQRVVFLRAGDEVVVTVDLEQRVGGLAISLWRCMTPTPVCVSTLERERVGVSDDGRREVVLRAPRTGAYRLEIHPQFFNGVDRPVGAHLSYRAQWRVRAGEGA